jgi:hypothetical protein
MASAKINIGGVKHLTPTVDGSNYRQAAAPRRSTMPGPQTDSEPGRGIWPNAEAVSAPQALTLLAITIAAFFWIDWALGASRARPVSGSDAAAPGPCPQSAETFDRQRAVCLQRRWAAMRAMRPWPDAPQNALLEDCPRSPGGGTAIPFKTNSCGNQKPSPRLLRAQN